MHKKNFFFEIFFFGIGRIGTFSMQPGTFTRLSLSRSLFFRRSRNSYDVQLTSSYQRLELKHMAQDKVHAQGRVGYLIDHLRRSAPEQAVMSPLFVRMLAPR